MKSVSAAKYSWKNDTATYYDGSNGQNILSKNAISFFIRYASISGEEPKYMAVLFRWAFFCSDKSNSETCKRSGPCWWAEKQKKSKKTQDSKWFNRYLWQEIISHVVFEIEKELRESLICKGKKQKITIHWIEKIYIQSKNIISLAATFDTVKFQFTDREDTNLYNILTGRLFRYNVAVLFIFIFLSIHVKEIQLFKVIYWSKASRRVNSQYSGSIQKSNIKGPLMQIWKSCYMFVFI